MAGVKRQKKAAKKTKQEGAKEKNVLVEALTGPQSPYLTTSNPKKKAEGKTENN
jgi:hypothetical protein